eukprot:TRINITY_DN821_c0_g1_i2.p1 TRINITY_DN821_c0_g1~~TRINITY_DN821_c0_g1_i2.p1  ORF type:complete len:403 (+),score=69.20 TRINITY_DN821_c0_g1_i2:184-1392(+)
MTYDKGGRLVIGGLEGSLGFILMSNIYSQPVTNSKGKNTNLQNNEMESPLYYRNLLHGSLMPFPHISPITLSRATRQLLFHHDSHLELWMLPPVENAAEILDVEMKEDGDDEDVKRQRKVGRTKFELSLRNQRPIHCSSLSPDGKWLAFCELSEVRLYRLSRRTTDNKISVESHRIPSKIQGLSANRVAFSPDSLHLVVATRLGYVVIYNLAKGSFFVFRHFDDDAEKRGAIVTLAFSSNSSLLAVGDLRNHIVIYNIHNREKVAVPSLESQHSALGFQLDSDNLVIATCSNEIYVFGVSRERFEFHRQLTIKNPKEWKLDFRSAPWIGIFMNAKNPEMIYVYSHDSVSAISGYYWQQNYEFRNNLFVDFVTEDELVVVRRDWMEIVKTLPAPIARKRFGRG